MGKDGSDDHDRHSARGYLATTPIIQAIGALPITPAGLGTQQAAMLYLWERMKIVVEPTGALAAAGLFAQRHDVRGRRVGVVISGGNVDLRAIGPMLA